MDDQSKLAAIYKTLSPQDKATVDALLADQAASAGRLAGIVPTLNSWATDANQAVAAWDGWTQVQKNAALKTVIDRFGTMVGRMADLLVVTDSATDI